MSNFKLHKTVPITLTIAGSDSGGGAGVQADIKAMSANGVYAASVITAVTAQNTCEVSAVYPIPVDVVAKQIDTVLNDLNVVAIKIGMLFSPELVETVAACLADFKGFIVLDPVMVAKSGDLLLEQSAVDALIDTMLPRADIITPNLPEASVLLGHPNFVEQTKQAQALIELGASNVLLKGGHGKARLCIDTLALSNGDIIELSAPRIDTNNTHGTGCTYSSAISAFLARGLSLQKAVEHAHQYLHQAILKSNRLAVGHGHGPVNHFYHYWQESG
jgi:hydroxymethylpyrimidine/phosphomethylpyrimidine kinase